VVSSSKFHVNMAAHNTVPAVANVQANFRSRLLTRKMVVVVTRATAWAVEMMIKNVMEMPITGENMVMKREKIPSRLLRA
jgi:hypothetical protein